MSFDDFMWNLIIFGFSICFIGLGIAVFIGGNNFYDGGLGVIFILFGSLVLLNYFEALMENDN